MLNGVVYYPPANADGDDPYYPKNWAGTNVSQTTPTTTDACLGHPDDMGIYHYHIMSPCLFNTNASYTSQICNTNYTACYNDIKGFALAGFSNEKALTVIGITKDGHPFFGPYDASGNEFNCSSLDACNGMTASNGSYAYYATNTFPYGPGGCWGPSVTPSPYSASCTSNACPYLASSSEILSISMIAVLAITVLQMVNFH